MSDDLKRVSGLFLRESKKNGNKYMAGATEIDIPAGSKLLVFRNDKKNGDSSPDYVLHMIAPDDQPPMKRVEPTTACGCPQQADDCDIPF